MKKVILGAITIACGLLMFYINHFQREYFIDNSLIVSLGVLTTIILVFLHIKVYKKVGNCL